MGGKLGTDIWELWNERSNLFFWDKNANIGSQLSLIERRRSAILQLKPNKKVLQILKGKRPFQSVSSHIKSVQRARALRDSVRSTSSSSKFGFERKKILQSKDYHIKKRKEKSSCFQPGVTIFLGWKKNKSGKRDDLASPVGADLSHRELETLRADMKTF